MAVICGNCKFCKETNADVVVSLKEASTGNVVQTQQGEPKRVLVCKPPQAVSGYPYRNRIVNRFGTCSMGEGQ